MAPSPLLYKALKPSSQPYHYKCCSYCYYFQFLFLTSLLFRSFSKLGRVCQKTLQYMDQVSTGQMPLAVA